MDTQIVLEVRPAEGGRAVYVPFFSCLTVPTILFVGSWNTFVLSLSRTVYPCGGTRSASSLIYCAKVFIKILPYMKYLYLLLHKGNGIHDVPPLCDIRNICRRIIDSEPSTVLGRHTQTHKRLSKNNPARFIPPLALFFVS